MASKNGIQGIQGDQANVSFHTQFSADTQISNSMATFNHGLSDSVQGNMTRISQSESDSPTIVVVSHTGELLEDSKEGLTSFLTLETKREILEALQRSGLAENEITTVVVEDPVLENITRADNCKGNDNLNLTSVSSYEHSAVLSVAQASHHSSLSRSSQSHHTQDVPKQKQVNSPSYANFVGHIHPSMNDLPSKNNVAVENGIQGTNSDLKQILSLLRDLHKDREQQEEEHRKFLRNMHKEEMAVFRQCLDVLKDVKESVKQLTDGPISDCERSEFESSRLSPMHDTFDEEIFDFKVPLNFDEAQNSANSKVAVVKETSENTQHSCEVCRKTFVRAKGLELHKRIHTKEKPYSCHMCGMRFRLSAQLNEHKKGHFISTPFVCDVCGKGFKHRSVMARHKLIHTGHKPHICKVCDRGFSRSDDLKVHLRVHEKSWICQCDVCGKGFKHKVNLQRHIRTHAKDRIYKHWCTVCGKGFSSNGHLREHFLTHTGEKPFVCDVCGKGCSSKTLLKRHKLSHTGEKPYKCNICGKGFITNTHLKRHKLSKHEDVKPYVCDLCNDVFESLHVLQMHTKIHLNG